MVKGRNSNTYNGVQWNRTEHNFDLIIEKEGQSYGIEVKNMLGYMDYYELKTKMEICNYIGVKPVFVARMMPKTWIKEIIDEGGFALILKYQLYPISHRDIAKEARNELGLPMDAPRHLEEGTIKRFDNWHKKNVKK